MKVKISRGIEKACITLLSANDFVIFVKLIK